MENLLKIFNYITAIVILFVFWQIGNKIIDDADFKYEWLKYPCYFALGNIIYHCSRYFLNLKYK